METSFSVGFCQFLFCLFLRAGNGAGKDGWRGKVVTAKREKTRYAGVTFRMVAGWMDTVKNGCTISGIVEVEEVPKR